MKMTNPQYEPHAIRPCFSAPCHYCVQPVIFVQPAGQQLPAVGYCEQCKVIYLAQPEIRYKDGYPYPHIGIYGMRPDELIQYRRPEDEAQP